MLCSKCKKNPATMLIKQNINGKITEYNLCEECAALTAGNMPFDTMLKNFMNSVMGLAGADGIKEKETTAVLKELKCPKCGLTYEGFNSSGKLGCANCYNAFRKQLITLFKNVHGSTSHTGKLPARGGAELVQIREIDRLKRRLKNLIDLEEFEEAAKVRDMLKAMQGVEQA